MKNKHNEGFSLVEVLVAIVILGIFVVPTCSSLVMAMQMNNKADELLQAQLAVSSTVEELKAKGITGTVDTVSDSGVRLKITQESGVTSYYNVEVSKGDVTVTTCIRAVETTPLEGEEGAG